MNEPEAQAIGNRNNTEHESPSTLPDRPYNDKGHVEEKHPQETKEPALGMTLLALAALTVTGVAAARRRRQQCISSARSTKGSTATTSLPISDWSDHNNAVRSSREDTPLQAISNRAITTPPRQSQPRPDPVKDETFKRIMQQGPINTWSMGHPGGWAANMGGYAWKIGG